MTGFPILHTARLLLRKIEPEDIPSLVKYASNKKISDNIINIPNPYEEHNAVFRISYVVQGYKNKSRYVFAIIYKDSEEFIGEISLHIHTNSFVAELGYWVAEPFWNKGIATEAIAAVLQFGFGTLNLQTIFATCHEENISSQKVVQKNGLLKGKTTGHVIQYIITKEET